MYYSNTDYSSYTQSSGEYYLDVEGKITSAIQKVLAEKKTKMYILKGHDEQEVGTTMSTSFSKMNIDTDELTLYSEDKVPSDCDILLINGATKDISKEEKNKILAYMKKGGNAVINLQYGTKDTPNLRALLKYYGLNEQIGSVCETQGNYYNYVNSVIPTLDSSNEIASGVSGVVVMPSPVGISKFKGARKSLTISEFMTTSKGSYLKLDTSSGKAAKEKGDIDGPFAMGVSVTDKIDDNKSAKLVVYASAYAFSDDVISTNQLDNGSLFTNAVKLLSNSDVEETSINAKSLSYTYVSLTQGTQFFWATVIIIIIPVGLLITGFAIWFSRRRK
jgi:ABC-2 type transport system permease protein